MVSLNCTKLLILSNKDIQSGYFVQNSTDVRLTFGLDIRYDLFSAAINRIYGDWTPK